MAALVAASCATPNPPPIPTATPPPPAAVGTDCARFAPDASGEFFAPFDVSFHDPTPLQWTIAAPADVGLDAAALNQAADNVALSAEVRSLLVARHGKLVFERYFNGGDPAEARTTMSSRA